ncbi:MAG TPA: type IV pilin protein [Gammaproteobacteria bacterium]|jgi:type IV pilus assembly protein PilE|nr:type IV pilin protein [Gammaproteobacteria bacterium]
MRNTREGGFTLIEMIITVLLVAITAVTAIYMYSSQIKRGRRIDAVNAMMSISLAEERYRTNNTTYGTLAQVWGGVTTSPDGYYTLAISNITATSYTITATATGAQANDADNGTSCATLTLAMSSGTFTKSPATCWPT